MKRSRWDSASRREGADDAEHGTVGGLRTFSGRAYTDDELSRRFEDAAGSGGAASEQLMDEETARRLVAAARSSEAAARPSVDEEPPGGHASPPPGLRSPSPAPARDRSRSRDAGARGPAPGARLPAGTGLEPGGAVRLDGLKAAAHLNGQLARLERLDPASGRWQVRLLDGDVKAIRAENLVAERGAGAEPQSPGAPPAPAVDVAPRSPPQSPASAPAPMGLGGVPIGSGVGEIGGLSSAALAGGPPPAAPPPRRPPSAAAPLQSNRRLGTIRWYNGRRKLGYLIPDGGGDDLFIPAQGAANGSRVPPQPGGLFHGTRVSFKPLELKPGDEGSSGRKEKQIVCMDVKALAGQAGLSVGVDTAAGPKEKNDDRIAACDLHELGFFCGIFDGHRGHACSEYVSKQLPTVVHTTYRARAKREGSLVRMAHEKEASIISSAIKEAFEAVDSAWLVTARKKELVGGSTGIVALVSHGFEVPVALPSASSLGCAALWEARVKPKAAQESTTPERRPCTVPSAPGGVAKLFVAWCGDCRAVLLRGRQGLRVSEDHRPARADEQKRVKQAGGMVIQDKRGIWRVGPRPDNKYVKELQKQKKDPSQDSKWFLSTSRSFGDAELKHPDPVVIATPELKVVDLAPEDWAVVLACDGIFDVLSDQVVADCAWRCMAGEGKDPVQTAKDIVQLASRRGSKDNLTVVVMRLGWVPPPDAGAAARGAEAAAKEAADDGLSIFG